MIVVTGREQFITHTQHVGRQLVGEVAQRLIDLFRGSAALQADGQVHGGDIHRGHTNCLRLQQTLQVRQNPLNPSGQLGVHRNDGLHGAAGLTQIGVVVAVDHRLIIHSRMNGCDDT